MLQGKNLATSKKKIKEKNVIRKHFCEIIRNVQYIKASDFSIEASSCAKGMVQAKVLSRSVRQPPTRAATGKRL